MVQFPLADFPRLARGGAWIGARARAARARVARAPARRGVAHARASCEPAEASRAAAGPGAERRSCEKPSGGAGRTSGELFFFCLRRLELLGRPRKRRGPVVEAGAVASWTACERCAAHCPAPPDRPRLVSRCATAGPAAVPAALSPGRRARGAAPGPAMWTPTEEEKYGVGR